MYETVEDGTPNLTVFFAILRLKKTLRLEMKMTDEQSSFLERMVEKYGKDWYGNILSFIEFSGAIKRA